MAKSDEWNELHFDIDSILKKASEVLIKNHNNRDYYTVNHIKST